MSTDAGFGWTYRRDFVAPEQARGRFKHTHWFVRAATHCNTLTQCNTLQHTATTLQHTATHCDHTAMHCNALQRTAMFDLNSGLRWQHVATHFNTLQHTATLQYACDTPTAHRITLKHTYYSLLILLFLLLSLPSPLPPSPCSCRSAKDSASGKSAAPYSSGLEPLSTMAMCVRN